MAILLGILIVLLVVSGKRNDVWGAVFKPVSSLQDGRRRAENVKKSTRRLLLCGAIAGPAFVLLVLLQDCTRPGVNPRTQDLSLPEGLEVQEMSEIFLRGPAITLRSPEQARGKPGGRGRPSWSP